MTQKTTKVHPFEKGGLGKAPYKFLGTWQLPPKSLLEHNPSAYNHQMAQAPKLTAGMGSCALCATYITNVFIVGDAEDNKWGIGSECILKHEAFASIQPVVKRAVKDHNKELKAKREKEAKEKLGSFLEDEDIKAMLKTYPHENMDMASKGFTMLDWAEWKLKNHYQSGWKEAVKFIKKNKGTTGTIFATTIIIQEYLSFVSLAIEEKGWASAGMVSRGDHNGPKTSTVALSSMELYKDAPELVDRHKRHEDEAEKALKWIRSLKDSDDKYINDLKHVASQNEIYTKDVGLITSLIPAYQRASEKKSREKVDKNNPSEWIGQIGDRLEIIVVVKAVFSKEGRFGPTYIYKLKDDDNNSFVWFASRPSLCENIQYKLKTTIKSHNEYMGVKETVIARAKIIGEKKE